MPERVPCSLLCATWQTFLLCGEKASCGCDMQLMSLPSLWGCAGTAINKFAKRLWDRILHTHEIAVETKGHVSILHYRSGQEVLLWAVFQTLCPGLKNHRPPIVQKTPQMVLRWLTGSGGTQAFPLVVVLEQMCVSLCNDTSPLQHSLTSCMRSGADDKKKKKLDTLAKISRPPYMHWIWAAWSFSRCSIFPTPLEVNGAAAVFFGSRKELSFCADEATHTGWGAQLPKTKHRPLQS